MDDSATASIGAKCPGLSAGFRAALVHREVAKIEKLDDMLLLVRARWWTSR